MQLRHPGGGGGGVSSVLVRDSPPPFPCPLGPLSCQGSTATGQPTLPTAPPPPPSPLPEPPLQRPPPPPLGATAHFYWGGSRVQKRGDNPPPWLGQKNLRGDVATPFGWSPSPPLAHPLPPAAQLPPAAPMVDSMQPARPALSEQAEHGQAATEPTRWKEALEPLALSVRKAPCHVTRPLLSGGGGGGFRAGS